MTRRAKIIATIGPACNSIQHLRELVSAGMDVARFNFSHGDHQEHARKIECVRQVSEESGRPITILQDLQGTKLRTGPLSQTEPILLRAGEHLMLTIEPTPGTTERIFVNYPALLDDIKPGDRILIDDGTIELKALGVTENDVETEVITGCELKECLARKRKAHIVIDECVTGSYHRSSLEGLALGTGVVNAADRLSLDAAKHCAGGAEPPFVISRLDGLFRKLTELVEAGPAELARRGLAGKGWMEQCWSPVDLIRRGYEPLLASARKISAAS